MTFTDLVNNISEVVGATSPTAKARIGKRINERYREIRTALGMQRSTRVLGITGATSLGLSSITFSNMQKVIRVYDDTSGSVRELTEIAWEEMRVITSTASDTATRWAIERVGASSVTIRFDVAFQTVFNLKADGHETIDDLSGVQEPAFPEDFHNILYWGVLEDELFKSEKELSKQAGQKYEKRLSDLRMWHVKRLKEDNRRGKHAGGGTLGATSSGGGGGGSATGSTSYEQTGLITFNRPGAAPFAVVSGSLMVANLDAQFLDGFEASDFAMLPLAVADIDAAGANVLFGRTGGAGAGEELTIGTDLEFSTNQLRIAAFTGDVTKAAGGSALTVANDAVTYAKMQNITATSRILGRKTAAAGDTEECTLSEILDFIGSATRGDILYRGASAWLRLPKGTTGQTLQMGADDPAWATVAAGGKPYQTFTPKGYEPTASNYATLDTRNAHPVLDFDGSTDEEAVWSAVLSPSYAGGGLTVEIWVAATSATSGNVRFQAAFERMDTSSLDIDADSFASFQSGGVVMPGTSGQLMKLTVTFTDGAQMDSLAAGEAYRLKIRRDADGTSGTDDVTTDAEVLAVVVREP